MNYESLNLIQKNILFASIIADGEITKCYPGSRRKNNSYREHYGKQQEAYRRWKASFYEGQLYIRSKGQYLVSKSDPYFTNLYPHFYNEFGKKRIPVDLLPICTMPHFLSILYLDDGSLCITKRINHSKKIIYLTPHIFLYLQNYPKEELIILKEHISRHFEINFKINKRDDGFGHILRLSTVKETLELLNIIKHASNSCSEMEYKSIGRRDSYLKKNSYKEITLIITFYLPIQTVGATILRMMWQKWFFSKKQEKRINK